jgi:hypothetical protein
MHKLSLLLFIFLLPACAGVPLPYTEHRLGNLPVEVSRKEVNTNCIDLKDFTNVSVAMEAQHLKFLRSGDLQDAISKEDFEKAVGDKCHARLADLTTAQVKTEMFGDLQVIPNAERLLLLGGVSFFFEDTSTSGGLEPTMHIRTMRHGPKERMVIIYRLEDGKVIHFVHSGTSDDTETKRVWALKEVFGTALSTAGRALVP